MNTRYRLREKPLSAIPISQNEIIRFKSEAIKELKIAGIKTDQKTKVIPGLSQSLGHRAVFLKCYERRKCAFKIELGIAPSDNQVAKTFTCPRELCNFQNKTYTELANHHLTCHRGQGETVKQTCCGEVFPFFEIFCEHVYIYHRRRSTSAICPYFENIHEENFDAYLDRHKVRFLDSFEMEVTFNHLLDLGGQIILSFDQYWIFMWNCQDFAVWYLCTLGIPLHVLDPTVSDKMTGSNKDSSARKVQGFKGWAWYKQPEQLKKFSSIADQARYACSKCDFLPPLTIDALNLHDQFAHNEQNTHHSDPNQVNEREVCHYLRGAGKGFSLLTEPTRKWNVYRLRGKSTTAHASVVFRPWILNNVKDAIRPSEIFVTVEKRLNYCGMPYLFVDDLDEKYHRKIENCCEIAVSIQELVDYVSLVYGCMISKGMSQTCVEYVYYLLEILFGDKNADRQAFVVESAYTRHRAQMRQYLYDRIAKTIDNEKFAVDIHSAVGSDTLTLQGRIAQVATRLHGKYQAMLPLHIMFMLALLYFTTIGELIFPLMILFTGYLMYCVVFSHYRVMGKRWLVLKISKTWNVETKLGLVQDAIHVLSMMVLVVEVGSDLDKLQSMVVLQMIWLHSLYMSREVEKRYTLTKRRFLGRLKPTVPRLLQLNLSSDFPRICVITTFCMPTYILKICIFVEFLLILFCSRAFTRRFQLKYFTGNENLEFHLFLFTFLLVMSGLLLYTGDIIKPDASVSNIHIVLFVIYFSISFYINSNVALDKIHYVQEISVTYQRLPTQENWEYLCIFLVILRKVGVLSLVLQTVGLTALLFSPAFQTMLIYISLVLYTHCISVCTAADVMDIMVTLIEDAVKKDNPTLQNASLL